MLGVAPRRLHRGREGLLALHQGSPRLLRAGSTANTSRLDDKQVAHIFAFRFLFSFYVSFPPPAVVIGLLGGWRTVLLHGPAKFAGLRFIGAKGRGFANLGCRPSLQLCNPRFGSWSSRLEPPRSTPEEFCAFLLNVPMRTWQAWCA